MRKTILGICIGLLTGLAVPVFARTIENVSEVNYSVFVNREAYNSEATLLNYGNRTYFPIYDLLDSLGVNYNWNDEEKILEIGKIKNQIQVENLKASIYDKLIIVVEKENRTAEVYAYEKQNNEFIEVLKTNGFVGSEGVSDTPSEGVSKTPEGIYTLGISFGLVDNVYDFKNYIKLEESDLWVDDINSKYYNKLVKSHYEDKDWTSAERLFYEKTAYKYGAVINYNTENIVRGAGSAFFLHCSEGVPTAGCVSVPENQMIELLKFIDDETRIILTQSEEKLYSNY